MDSIPGGYPETPSEEKKQYDVTGDKFSDGIGNTTNSGIEDADKLGTTTDLDTLASQNTDRLEETYNYNKLNDNPTTLPLSGLTKDLSSQDSSQTSNRSETVFPDDGLQRDRTSQGMLKGIRHGDSPSKDHADPLQHYNSSTTVTGNQGNDDNLGSSRTPGLSGFRTGPSRSQENVLGTSSIASSTNSDASLPDPTLSLNKSDKLTRNVNQDQVDSASGVTGNSRGSGLGGIISGLGGSSLTDRTAQNDGTGIAEVGQTHEATKYTKELPSSKHHIQHTSEQHAGGHHYGTPERLTAGQGSSGIAKVEQPSTIKSTHIGGTSPSNPKSATNAGSGSGIPNFSLPHSNATSHGYRSHATENDSRKVHNPDTASSEHDEKSHTASPLENIFKPTEAKSGLTNRNAAAYSDTTHTTSAENYQTSSGLSSDRDQGSRSNVRPPIVELGSTGPPLSLSMRPDHAQGNTTSSTTGNGFKSTQGKGHDDSPLSTYLHTDRTTASQDANSTDATYGSPSSVEGGKKKRNSLLGKVKGMLH